MKKNKKRKPALTANAVAALLAGPEKAKALKLRWDGRRGFYPPALGRGPSGSSNLYDPLALIARAVAAGDVDAERAEVACRVVGHLGDKLPASR